MFEELNKIVRDFFSHPVFNREKVYTDEDCEVSYHPEILCRANMPGEYVPFEEIY